MPISPLPNETLLSEKIAKGDEQAFKIVYNHYHKNVYTFALWYLKSELDAEEVVQESFLKLWLLGDKLIEIENLQKYLRTIVGNKALDRLRSNSKQIATSSLEDTEEIRWVNNETEEGILLNDLKQIYQNALSRLPEQQRKIYLMCKEQGMKNDEVAQQLKLSPHTVRTHLKLALRFLRSYIKLQTNHTLSWFICSIILKFF